jgi:predicted CXXCH cytochrome family protein
MAVASFAHTRMRRATFTPLEDLTMKRFAATLFAVAFLATATVAIAAPDSVTLTAKNGNVTFNHKGHAAAMDCKTCHGEGTPAKLTLGKDAGHALCLDCHKTKAAGPTKCGECHKK